MISVIYIPDSLSFFVLCVQLRIRTNIFVKKPFASFAYTLDRVLSERSGGARRKSNKIFVNPMNIFRLRRIFIL